MNARRRVIAQREVSFRRLGTVPANTLLLACQRRNRLPGSFRSLNLLSRFRLGPFKRMKPEIAWCDAESEVAS